jgi:Undecaprenyl-phosphate galactose phosphotransferase WbaP
LAPHLATEFDIPYAIVSMPSLTGTERANLLMRCAKFFDHVLVLPDEPSLPAFWTTARSGEGLFGYSVQNTSLRPVERFVKRTVDLLGAGLVMLLLMPVLAMIAVAISRDSPGGVLYRQERMGLNGGIFTVLKFRTMYADADQKLDRILAAAPARRREYERYHKLQDDPRVTPVGRFLRRYSIDELPQIFNVLCGDMSLVGPRAYMPGELPEMNGLSRAVLQVPPGITGLWQVSGRNALSFEERLDLDVHYVQNWSAWLDLYLLVRTVPTVVSGDGAS